ncbi:MAG: F0F1 ATP synthase subunit A [bacterium]
MSSHGFGYNGNLGYYFLFGGIVTAAAFIFTFLVNSKRKKNKSEVPSGIQNIGEAVVEFLVNLIEPVLGKDLAPAALPFLGAFFIFIILSNALLIVPHPFSNPPTGDISVTLALAFICVFGIQIYNFFIVNGPKKALKMWLNPVQGLGGDNHDEYGEEKPKEKKSFKKKLLEILKSVPMKLLVAVFIVLKVVDNLARLLSLSLRLFGNIYGEHTILGETTAMAIARPALIVTLFIPFLILCFDIMVALIQAVVFTNLSLFYMKEEWGVHD